MVPNQNREVFPGATLACRPNDVDSVSITLGPKAENAVARLIAAQEENMSVQPLPAAQAVVSTAIAATATQPSPAAMLTGQTLPSGWKLVQQLSKSPGGSGSNFCVGYIAERNGNKAFVKAIDFVKALNAADPIAELAKLTSLATFEREAMELCEAQNLSRLIRLFSFEYVNLDSTKNPLNQVYCLIMEIGAGDLRKQLSHVGVFSCSAVFAILADVALGMSQLHRHGVAHQDIKPSNVISMTDMSAPKNALFKVKSIIAGKLILLNFVII